MADPAGVNQMTELEKWKNEAYERYDILVKLAADRQILREAVNKVMDQFHDLNWACEKCKFKVPMIDTKPYEVLKRAMIMTGGFDK